MDSPATDADMLFWLEQTSQACKSFSFDHQGQHRFSPDLSALSHAACGALGAERFAEYRKHAGFLVASAFLAARAETACALPNALEEAELAAPGHAAFFLSKAAGEWRRIAGGQATHERLRNCFSFFLTGCQIALACGHKSQRLGPKHFAAAALAIGPALDLLSPADIEALAKLGAGNDAAARFAEHATTQPELSSACSFAASPEFSSAAELRILEHRAGHSCRKNTPKL